MITPASAFPNTKKHFLILDALRGVASLVVVLYHILEPYSGGDAVKQLINHGYLAVDFFFMLSGYVMAHAYDDRWGQMTIKDFFKRRLIRLHPLIILGMTIGALCFYFSASPVFPKVADTTIWQVLLIMLIGYTLLPIPPSMDIRGWDEMHPLNGSAWSLFFEYIANILHVFVLRKLPKIILGIFVAIAAAALIRLGVTNGIVNGGWTVNAEQLGIGFTRLLFPYMAGMLLRRMIKVVSDKKTFWLSSILLVVALSVPRIGGYEFSWENGLYDALVIICVFPVVVYLGAIGQVKGIRHQKMCTFLGDISYPIYILHFPFIYIYTAWIANNNIPIEQGFFVGLLLLAFAILLSYLALKYYDEPIRKWLTKKYLIRK